MLLACVSRGTSSASVLFPMPVNTRSKTQWAGHEQEDEKEEGPPPLSTGSRKRHRQVSTEEQGKGVAEAVGDRERRGDEEKPQNPQVPVPRQRSSSRRIPFVLPTPSKLNFSLSQPAVRIGTSGFRWARATQCMGAYPGQADTQ
jgi:hypothetical protein